MVHLLHNAAQVFAVTFLGLFLLVSIDSTTCIGLALAMAALGSLQYVLEQPTISVFVWGTAAIFLYVYGVFIWRPSRGLLFVLAQFLAQLWRRGRIVGA